MTVKTYPAARTLIRLPLAIPSEHLQMWCMMKHIQTSKGMDQLGLHKLNQEEKSHNCNTYLYISIISKKGQVHDDTTTQYNLRVTLSVVGWCQCSEHSDTTVCPKVHVTPYTPLFSDICGLIPKPFEL